MPVLAVGAFVAFVVRTRPRPKAARSRRRAFARRHEAGVSRIGLKPATGDRVKTSQCSFSCRTRSVLIRPEVGARQRRGRDSGLPADRPVGILPLQLPQTKHHRGVHARDPGARLAQARRVPHQGPGVPVLPGQPRRLPKPEPGDAARSLPGPHHGIHHRLPLPADVEAAPLITPS